jgi:hypothetical protein
VRTRAHMERKVIVSVLRASNSSMCHGDIKLRNRSSGRTLGSLGTEKGSLVGCCEYILKMEAVRFYTASQRTGTIYTLIVVETWKVK